MSDPSSSSPRPVLSVVVPVRNEAGNIAPLIAEIHRALAPVLKGPHEVVYVDDGSTDGTVAELAAVCAADPLVRVVRHRRACGQSQATISGVVAARADWIATLDGDGQNDPADLARLLTVRGRTPGADRTLFIGWRRMRHDGGARVLASQAANLIRRVLLGDGTSDSGCGMKLLRRDLFLQLPRFNALHRFTPALVRRAGGNVVPVTIGHRPRVRGTSKYGIVGRGLIGVADLLGVFWLMRRHTQPDVTDEGASP
jgi:dolichol-phosphate mannosyltransferase